MSHPATFNRQDILGAYWLFGCEHHGGPDTYEYKIILRARKCGFQPGSLFAYSGLSDNGKIIYDVLLDAFKDRIGSEGLLTTH